jgi:hypothetical protein
VLLNLLMVPVLIFAEGIYPTATDQVAGGIGKDIPKVTSIDETLNTVANYAIGVLIVVAVFYIIWAGYTFVAHGTDPDAVTKARQRIMFAGIGVIVALLAKGIVSLVLAAMKPAS